MSTASIGKFDKRRHDEPAPKVQARRKKKLPQGNEKKRDLEVLRKVLGGTGEGDQAASGGVVVSKKRSNPPASGNAKKKTKRRG